jgi:uncharacterized protein (TIGR02246 family)
VPSIGANVDSSNTLSGSHDAKGTVNLHESGNSTREQLHDLTARYSDAVNRRDASAWAATWSEDAEWTLLGSTTRGKGEILRRWEELMAGVPVVIQLLSFGVVNRALEENRAAGRWYLTEITHRESGSARVTGLYRDDYVREQGAWLFARRRFDILHAERNLPGEISTFPFPEG